MVTALKTKDKVIQHHVTGGLKMEEGVRKAAWRKQNRNQSGEEKRKKKITPWRRNSKCKGPEKNTWRLQEFKEIPGYLQKKKGTWHRVRLEWGTEDSFFSRCYKP